MKTIYALTDYQGRFGSKYFDKPYRSGMDKEVLRTAFKDYNIDLEYVPMSETEPLDQFIGKYVIYTSQEDFGYHYKSYIEDLILGMEQVGVLVLPAYKYLRANNNKVFMEILRKQQLPREYFMSRRLFGCFEELESVTRELRYPVVVKSAAGAGSTGVFIAGSKQELFAKAKRISQTRNIREELREIVRSYRHRGYIRESRFREKFIVQDFIPGLTNDWKVLVYYDKYYVLRRNNRPGDFKASGSGLFYFEEVVDQDLLNAAQEICDCFQLPMMSLDLAKSGTDVYLIEIQFLYFGTSTLEKSPYYYIKEETSWKQVHAQSVLESEYARSITKHIFGKV